ncbi:hypothetical protein Lspi_1898 [Legionella spiritensis]|uniref:Uncharacterized protein n=1 Tax=Legionella spiritensis TaxID=452 RepID=A0A0W0YYR8_LEGSP|nr:hypothetical protein Lspi_1898 [Legionella spiritensis]SNV34509.1 Uncharacterised protein [Legionella spiritensis]
MRQAPFPVARHEGEAEMRDSVWPGLTCSCGTTLQQETRNTARGLLTGYDSYAKQNKDTP